MKRRLVIGMDASRCRSGGAFTHLAGVLSHLDPAEYGIERVHLWSFPRLLDTIPDYPWLVKHAPAAVQATLPQQLYWQATALAQEAAQARCDILCSLDASTLCRFKPQVVFSRDLLSYEPGVMQLYGWSKARLRLLAILWLQNHAFRRAQAVVFLTKCAGRTIQRSCGPVARMAYIPHGADSSFQEIEHRVSWPQPGERPISCIYISNAAPYKHQSEVVRAIAALRRERVEIQLTLVGGGSGTAQKQLVTQMALSDPKHEFVEQREFVPHGQLVDYLSRSDIFIFASSAEAFGITLLEGMAAGLPIACSDRSCLPELLEDGGVYFNPEDHLSIVRAVRQLIDDPHLRDQVASRARELSRAYSWSRCARETWAFVTETARMAK